MALTLDGAGSQAFELAGGGSSTKDLVSNLAFGVRRALQLIQNDMDLDAYGISSDLEGFTPDLDGFREFGTPSWTAYKGPVRTHATLHVAHVAAEVEVRTTSSVQEEAVATRTAESVLQLLRSTPSNHMIWLGAPRTRVPRRKTMWEMLEDD